MIWFGKIKGETFKNFQKNFKKKFSKKISKKSYINFPFYELLYTSEI